MTIGSDGDDYLQLLINLSPTGLAWPTDPASNWVKLLDAIAQEYARIDAHAVLLLNEAFPDTTAQLLPNWERVAGLPDECTPIGATYAIRRANLIAKLTNAGGQSKAYFIALAALFGYTITISEFTPFRVEINAVGDALWEEDAWFLWQVNAPLNTITYFRAGVGGAGEPLRSWGNETLECILQKYAPAHTKLQFAYS